MRLLMRVLPLVGWVAAAPLLGLAAGVTRADLLLVVPATALAVTLVAVTVRRRVSPFALAPTITATVLLAALTWGPITGGALCVTAALAADQAMSFLRRPRRRSTGPRRA
ncbi:hypothetical protein [Nonomuraea wenchangensis]|uniref:Uncharacterized protein n=1 Tax=Nonomuraea wenchangensis TaxID=568860 RepID=A0A1I0LUC7_9ACTN|nr:hypothetical protein [Nonomuraea wenchangensis]SEU46716.1 hypothetical protein SAMN05421811_127128 [Nonomuraea wenchangensis]